MIDYTHPARHGRHHAPARECTPDLYVDWTAHMYEWYPSATLPAVRVPVAQWSRGPRHAVPVSLVKGYITVRA